MWNTAVWSLQAQPPSALLPEHGQIGAREHINTASAKNAVVVSDAAASVFGTDLPMSSRCGVGGSRGVKEIRLTEFRATGQRTWEFISGRRSTTARYTLRSRVYLLLYPAPSSSVCADSCVICASVDDNLCVPW